MEYIFSYSILWEASWPSVCSPPLPNDVTSVCTHWVIASGERTSGVAAPGGRVQGAVTEHFKLKKKFFALSKF